MMDASSSLNKTKYIVDNFSKAMEEGWIEVYYQPIVRTSNERVCCEESLMRWNDPEYGMLMPGEVLPVLEGLGESYRLDLFVLEQTLIKMNEQREKGLYLVPISVNISKADFYSCDLVEEIARRVEKYRISRRLIAIEISEVVLAERDEYIIEQLDQLRELGFQIWLDDYGSGDGAPTLLQRIHFDALKINRSMSEPITYSDGSRIIVTELIRMALSLKIETIVEGVELNEQIEFLKEIGCTKVQGYFYCKPVTKAQIFERYVNGTAIGFENPAESDYYAATGSINLYDISFAREKGDNLENYFDTFPIAILETDEKTVRINRANKSFKRFFSRNFIAKSVDSTYSFSEGDSQQGMVGKYTMSEIRKCSEEGVQRIIDDRLRDGKNVQILLQRIATNPVTKVKAILFVILQVAEKQASAENLSYNYIARALSEDYLELYYVDTDNGEYVKYSPDGLNRDVTVENKGDDFFKKCATENFSRIFEDDREMVITNVTREKILSDIKTTGAFTITYRRIINGEPVYINLKAVKVRTDNHHILIGVSNVDSQMKEREVFERVKEERITYSRVMALSGDFMCIYSVNPETNHYTTFISSDMYNELNIPKESDDFFAECKKNSKEFIHPDDLKVFNNVIKKEYMLEQVNEYGLFVHKYRMMYHDAVIHTCLKAAMIQEASGPHLIVGLQNIESQYAKEMEYTTMLLETEDRAIRDALTGVKNKRAYVDEEEHLNIQIQSGAILEFAIIVCDLNGLKHINDTLGHKAGDEYIKEGCQIICEIFSRSPVLRVGGDEFVVVAQGKDYESLDNRLEKINKANKKNKKAGKVTIAFGASRFDKDKFVSDVFQRADSAMYKNKKVMKQES